MSDNGTQIVWKVTAEVNGGHWSAFYGIFACPGIQYIPDMWTTPSAKGHLLFAFNKQEAAQEFAETTVPGKAAVWRAEGLDVAAFALNAKWPWGIDRFWQGRVDGLTWSIPSSEPPIPLENARTPPGTVACSAIKLLEKIG